jgi:hypothetical protein
MKKHFYSHLLELDSVYIELEKLDLNDEERKDLAEILEAHLHNVVLDVILSKLNEKDKELFAKKLAEDQDNDAIWEFLDEKVNGIDAEIKSAAKDLKKELHQDIDEAKGES